MIKLTINREELLKPIQLVAGVVGRQQTMPILSHILLIVQNKTLTIIGADFEVELCAIINMEHPASKPIEITLPGKKLLDICRALPENCLIELSENNGHVTLASGKSRFILTTLPAQNFPRSPEQKDIMEFPITQGALKNLIEKTSFSIPQQDVRQYLNGLLLEVKDGLIKSLATDGHRLAMNGLELPIESNNSFAQVIIPRKGIFELLRLLDDSNEEVVVGFNNNFVRIRSKNFILTSKLISGKFPNYNKIIPKKGPKIAKIDREELKQALTRVNILSNELFRSVRFQLLPNNLLLTTNNPEQEEAVEELVIDYKNEKLDAIFNIGYLMDIINTIEAQKINIYFTDGESGAVIEGIDKDINCLYAIMPIRKQ